MQNTHAIIQQRWQIKKSRKTPAVPLEIVQKCYLFIIPILEGTTYAWMKDQKFTPTKTSTYQLHQLYCQKPQN